MRKRARAAILASMDGRLRTIDAEYRRAVAAANELYDQRARQLLADVAAGATYEEIAADLGIRRQRVGQLVLRARRSS